MSRGKITGAVSIVVLALFIYFLHRDINISKDILDGHLPDIVVERLDFARVIKGREWKVRLLYAESESGIIRARSMDVCVFDIAEEKSSNIYAESGEYSTESGKMWLYGVNGVAALGDRSVDFSARRADYDSSADVWYFSEGISASDDQIHVTGGVGKIEPKGVLTLGKGVFVRWNMQ